MPTEDSQFWANEEFVRRGICEKITPRVDFLKPRTLYYSEEKIFDSGEIFQIHRGPRWRIFQRGTTFFPPRQYSATQLDRVYSRIHTHLWGPFSKKPCLLKSLRGLLFPIEKKETWGWWHLFISQPIHSTYNISPHLKVHNEKCIHFLE